MMNGHQDLKKIPYGISNYNLLREENCYYVDKTGYIRNIEDKGRFIFFIRPRRFGKSLQLKRYSGDEKFQKTIGHTKLVKLVLVFCGHRLVYKGEAV
jgi:hypothetical protein